MMSEGVMNSTNTIDGSVRILRIITVTLVMGVVAYGSFVVFGMEPPDPALAPPADPTMLRYIGAGFALICFILHFVIPGLLVRQSAKDSVRGQESLIGAYTTKTLVALAMLEGPAFLNILAYGAERQWWSLAIAGGLVFWMLARFPSRTMIENWIASQQP